MACEGGDGIASREEAAWEVDRVFFSSIDKLTFMNEIRKYPEIYDATQTQATGLEKKHKSRAKRNAAIGEIAKKFKGTPSMVDGRYHSLRTIIGRYLKGKRPAGCHGNDFDISPSFEPYSWLFEHVKTRSSMSKCEQRASVSVDETAIGLHSNRLEGLDNSFHIEEVHSLSSKKKRVTPVERTQSKRAEDVGRSLSELHAKQRRTDKTLDGIHKMLERNSRDNDSVSLFLRSLAPRIHEISSSNQLQVQCEIMQVVDRHYKLEQRDQVHSAITQQLNAIPVKTSLSSGLPQQSSCNGHSSPGLNH